MTRFLPPQLQALFVTRPMPDYLSPPEVRRSRGYTGLHPFICKFEKETSPSKTPPIEILRPEEIRERKKRLRIIEHENETNKKFKLWDPYNNPKATEEEYKTLFVSRLNYNTTEETLRKEFEKITDVKTVRIVRDLEGKSRGYAFVELVDDNDLKRVFDLMKDREIDGFRILTDVERGRTVNDWRPRRFGNKNNTPRIALPKGKKRLPPPSRDYRDSDDRGYSRNRGRYYDRRGPRGY